jgi:hypothetical protein
MKDRRQARRPRAAELESTPVPTVVAPENASRPAREQAYRDS